MKKTIYLGPTIIGVATTSTVFDGTALPATITEAAQEEPALLSLCVPIANASKAMQEITNGKGPAAVFYRKALASASIFRCRFIQTSAFFSKCRYLT